MVRNRRRPRLEGLLRQGHIAAAHRDSLALDAQEPVSSVYLSVRPVEPEERPGHGSENRQTMELGRCRSVYRIGLSQSLPLQGISGLAALGVRGSRYQQCRSEIPEGAGLGFRLYSKGQNRFGKE